MARSAKFAPRNPYELRAAIATLGLKQIATAWRSWSNALTGTITWHAENPYSV
jgi:hypothetical protein